jgi:hypothetical protein
MIGVSDWGGFMSILGRRFQAANGIGNLIAYGAARKMKTFGNCQFHPGIHRIRRL